MDSNSKKKNKDKVKRKRDEHSGLHDPMIGYSQSFSIKEEIEDNVEIVNNSTHRHHQFSPKHFNIKIETLDNHFDNNMIDNDDNSSTNINTVINDNEQNVSKDNNNESDCYTATPTTSLTSSFLEIKSVPNQPLKFVLKISSRNCTAIEPTNKTITGNETVAIEQFDDNKSFIDTNFNNENNLPKNLEKQIKKFICQICGRGFNYKHALKNHRVVHTGEKNFRCDICMKPLSNATAVIHHRKTHLNYRDFHCDHPGCGKSFITKSNWMKHCQTHTNERPYECEFKNCNKKFIDKYRLELHRKDHTKENMFQCNYCNDLLKTKYALRIHRRKHVGAKPYICQYCGRGFRLQGTFYKHMQTHIGKRYACNQCNKKFIANYLLKNHLLTHSSDCDKPYACNACDKSYYSQRALKQHQKKLEHLPNTNSN